MRAFIVFFCLFMMAATGYIVYTIIKNNKNNKNKRFF